MPCFEDLNPGATLGYGTHLVTHDELVRYAREFDPQPMHLDGASAQAQEVGGLIGSGWQSAAINHAMMLDALVAPGDVIAVPGVQRLKWAAPTRVGDLLTGSARVLRRRLSRTRTGVGLVDLALTLTNQRGETVLEVDQRLMLATRATNMPQEDAALLPLPTEDLPRQNRQPPLGPVEEMPVGLVIPAGSHVFTRQGALRFATRYDPLPCLLDERTPRVSGWQFGAQWLRQMVDLFHAREAAGETLPRRGPGMGLADMAWLRPVMAGDTLHYYSRVVAARASASKPGWGILTLRNYAFNQQDQPVLAFTCFWLWEARKA